MATLYGTLAAPKFGTTDETGIIVETGSKTTASEKVNLADGAGAIKHVALHGKETELSVDFTVKATGYPDEALVDGTITISDTELAGKYIVQSVGNTKTKNAFMTGSMTLYKYDDFPS